MEKVNKDSKAHNDQQQLKKMQAVEIPPGICARIYVNNDQNKVAVSLDVPEGSSVEYTFESTIFDRAEDAVFHKERMEALRELFHSLPTVQAVNAKDFREGRIFLRHPPEAVSVFKDLIEKNMEKYLRPSFKSHPEQFEALMAVFRANPRDSFLLREEWWNLETELLKTCLKRLACIDQWGREWGTPRIAEMGGSGNAEGITAG